MSSLEAEATPDRDPGSRAAMLALSAAALTASWSIAIVASGGVDLRAAGVPLVARTASPTAVAAILLFAACALARRARLAEDGMRLLATLRRAAAPLAWVLALAVAAVAVRFGTFAVGGSDSNCYVAQAERWASGTMRSPLEPGFEANWPDAVLSLTPTGFVPSRTVEGAMTPICPAGLALAMAVPRVLGAPRDAVFYVVPLAAGVAVLCTFLVGRRLAGPLSGLAAAMLAAASPVFLYQAVQPMSDVPAASCWVLALALAWHASPRACVATGLAAGAAVLVRPNLSPLAVLFVAFAAAGGQPRSGSASGRLGRAAAVIVGLLPFLIAVGAVQHLLYGSPFSSGYGSLDALFRLSHVPANLARYPRWLVETQSPVVLLGLAAPLAVWLQGRRATDTECGRRVGYACLNWLFALGAFAAYLPYVPFDRWWFLRFWLPGLLPLLALAVCSVAASVAPSARQTTRGATRPGSATRAVTGALALFGCVALGAWQLGVARDRSVFDLRRFERKFVVAGEFVSTLPASAVVLAVWHSGAVQYYGGRPAVVWDAIPPGGLDAVVGSLRAQGREVFLLLEPREEEPFKARFGTASAYAHLDWPPRARFGSEVTLWALADRDRFLRGEVTRSERVWVR